MKKILLCYGDFFSDTGFALRIKNEIDLLEESIAEDVFLISFASSIYYNPFALKKVENFFTLKRHTFPPFFIIDMVKAMLIIRKISKKDDEIVLLHAHNLYSTFIAIFFKLLKNNVKVIFDVHGVVPQEYLWLKKGRRWGLAYICLKIIERFCALQSDYLICASKTLKEYFEEKYKVSNKIDVIPNISPFPKRDLKELNSVKLSVKKQFGLEDAFVFLHIGSFLQWTDAEKTIEIFKKLGEFFSNAFLLIMTYEKKESVSFFLLKNNVLSSQFLVTHVPHEEISQFIPVGDFGLIMRDNSLINQVAFPTKFSEYLACGVPVLCSDSIIDIAHNIKVNKLGYVLYNNELDTANLKNLINKDEIEKIRYNCVKYFAQELNKAKKKMKGLSLIL
jgi:glycosyltransferase involved in cell wall biosynthesis